MGGMGKPYAVITSDAHAGASVQAYREYLEPKLREKFDEWRGSYRNPQREHIGSKKHKNWDDAERIADMDREGVAGEILFPNTVPPFFRTSVLICGNPSREDYALRLEGIRAHNRWLLDFQNEQPLRRAGVGIVYLNDIDEAIRDVEWIAKSGLKGGILLPHVPDDCTHILPLYAPGYDRFWKVCEDLGVVLNHHGGTGSPDYGDYPISLPIRFLETPWFSTRSWSHLLLAGVFHRFPKLRYIITESGCGWVPQALEQADRIWSFVRKGFVGEFQFDPEAVTPEPPSFYAKRNVWYGASAASPAEVRERHAVGVDRFCWGTDYPHYEGTFPYTREALRHTFHDVPEHEARRMLGENAAALYGFDLEALAPIVDRIGPRPEDLARPLEASEFPERTMSMAFSR
jgi:predicted TIM-barrel fold metal-dependent hydrolase